MQSLENSQIGFLEEHKVFSHTFPQDASSPLHLRAQTRPFVAWTVVWGLFLVQEREWLLSFFKDFCPLSPLSLQLYFLSPPLLSFAPPHSASALLISHPLYSVPSPSTSSPSFSTSVPWLSVFPSTPLFTLLAPSSLYVPPCPEDMCSPTWSESTTAH